MSIKKIVKGSVTALVVASSLVSAAYADGVACPTAEEVSGASKALNAVIRQGQKTFFVLSAQPALQSSDLGWIILSMTSSKGFDEAYSTGASNVKSVSMSINETAEEQQGMYICTYMSAASTVGIVAAIAPQQQGLVFNPSKLNLDVLKAKS
jgi:hypothetical protein